MGSENTAEGTAQEVMIEPTSIGGLSAEEVREAALPIAQRIRERRERLQTAAAELKTHFVGLDGVIDRIVAGIEVWYVLPEVVTRPTIICLWGLTGVGKTDLVRRLTALLGCSHRYVEMQLTNKSSGYSSTVADILDGSNLEPGASGVLLLDEIQRFRSVDKGEDIHDYQYQDVWDLLSDGRFTGSYNNRERIAQMLYDLYQEQVEDQEPDEPTVPETGSGNSEESQALTQAVEKMKAQMKKKHRRLPCLWEIRRLKNVLHLTESVGELLTWSRGQRIEALRDGLRKNVTYTGPDYTKLLIFISGNLDEAYRMASACDEADVDADVFHEHSRTIDIVKIKAALQQRFRAEQIARMGNNYVIYPSLSKESYRQIIRRRAESILSGLFDSFGVDVQVDQTVLDVIYANGVFPAQGTRPVFSTITDMLENRLSEFVLYAVEHECRRFMLRYDAEALRLVAEFADGNSMERPYEGDLDRARKNRGQKRPARVAISIHEAGHGVAYAVLFHTAPTQLLVNSSMDWRGGFMGSHEIFVTKQAMKHRIMVYLAGLAAENLVIGDQLRTHGCSSDLRVATRLAVNYVRKYAMCDRISVATREGGNDADEALCVAEGMDFAVEELLSSCQMEVKRLLEAHSDLLATLTTELVEKGALSAIEFQEICGAFGIEAEVCPADQELLPTGIEEAFEGFRAHMHETP